MNGEKVLPADAKGELDRLIAGFFRAVSFEQGEKPQYGEPQNLIINRGLLIKNSSTGIASQIEDSMH